MMAEKRDYYEVLEVPRNANLDEIRRAFAWRLPERMNIATACLGATAWSAPCKPPC